MFCSSISPQADLIFGITTIFSYNIAYWPSLDKATQYKLVLYHSLLADGGYTPSDEEINRIIRIRKCVNDNWYSTLVKYNYDLSVFALVNSCYFSERINTFDAASNRD